MNELMTIMGIEESKRTLEQKEAIICHEQLVIHKQMVNLGLEGMCRDLKEIRDKKHYAVLGYKDFSEYTESEHGIKQRMAYKYIKAYEELGPAFLHSSAKLGVTKLLEISVLDNEERAELLNEHTVEELSAMNTDEVKKLVAEKQRLEEQITFLTAEVETGKKMPDTVEQRPFEEIEAEIRAEVEDSIKAEYEERIFALECKNVTDEELKTYKANAEKEAKAAAAEELKKAKAELKAAMDEADKKDAIAKNAAKAIADAEQRAKAAEEKAKQAAEDIKRVEELEKKIRAAEAEKTAMERQIRQSIKPELTRFKFLYSAWEDATTAMGEQFKLIDEDNQAKMKKVINSTLKELGL